MTYAYEADKVYCELVRYVINSEGGYVNNLKDKGGPTKYGVAWNYNAGYLKDHFKMVNPIDIKQLTYEQACQVYYDRYWLPSGSTGITNTRLAYIHIDAAINCGVGQAQLFLDRLTSDPRHFDGSGGKNETLFNRLFLEYVAQRLAFYTHARGRKTFLEGWVNRISDVIRNSLGIA